MSTAAPPRLAELLLEAVTADAETREAVLGDLSEAWARDAATAGERRAAARFWTETLRSAPPLAAGSLRRARPRAWLRTLAAVVAGYVTLAVGVVAVSALAGALLRPAPSPTDWRLSLAFLVVAALCAALGGWVAAAVGRAAPLASALLLGIACCLLGLMLVATTSDGTPLWYRIALPLVAPPAAFAGGVLRVRRRPPPSPPDTRS